MKIPKKKYLFFWGGGGGGGGGGWGVGSGRVAGVRFGGGGQGGCERRIEVFVKIQRGGGQMGGQVGGGQGGCERNVGGRGFGSGWGGQGR